MVTGVRREITSGARRVGLVAESARDLTAPGRRFAVEGGAGPGIGQTDEAYSAVGARTVDGARAVFDAAGRRQAGALEASGVPAIACPAVARDPGLPCVPPRPALASRAAV